MAVDSIFMMPHLGVLAQIHEKAAEEVFLRDCLIPLGTCVAACQTGKPGSTAFEYSLRLPGGKGTRTGSLQTGEMTLEALGVGEEAEVEVRPARGVDLGNGRGVALKGTVHGGVVGVAFDARGRPLVVPSNESERKAAVECWANGLGAYPR